MGDEAGTNTVGAGAPAGSSSQMCGNAAWAEPSVGWAVEPLGAVQAAAREMSRQAALRARAVAAFAAARPATTDRAQGERGAMSAERWAARAEVLRPVSEWAAHELSIALDVTVQAAEAELERSLTLVTRLPRVLDALQGGVLHERHLWCLLEHVAPIADDALRARVEQDLLGWMAARTRVTTPAALADRVRRVVTRLNARDAARDLARALQRHGISVREDRALGMSVVTLVCSTPEAQAFYRALSACVDALDVEPGDRRTRGQRLVDCLLDLVLRPAESGLPPVQALLTIVASVRTALGGDAAGEVDGKPVPAEMARQLARAFAGLPPTLPRDGVATDDAAGPEDDVVAADVQGEPADGSPAADSAARPAVMAPADPAGGEPVDFAGDPVERAVQEFSAADFDRWLDELVRDAFGDDPAPGEPGWSPGLPPDPGEWDAGPWEDACQWLDNRGRAPDPGDPAAQSPTSPLATASGEGWWAAADRAVDQAGAAVHAARLALVAAERMVRTAQRADVADEAAWQAGAAGRVTAAEDALTDAVSGALLALTDLLELRRAGSCGAAACRRTPEACGHGLTGRPGLGAPTASAGYRPAAALDRFARARDRHCRFPGCRRRIPVAGELDHLRAWPDGPTAAANLAGFCTTNHRGKHQAPGWTYAMTSDGTLTVTTPTGLTATTEPPPY